jgi:RND family efflux transporter MFP subunit
LVLARASHERIASLQATRSATAQELDDATAALRSAYARVSGASARVRQARAAFESAEATSDQANTTQSFATIVAPFDGVVTEKLVELGNMVSPGTPLLRLEDTRGFRLEVRIDESRVADIRRGDRVPVLLGSDGFSTAGTVTEVSRAIDADAHAFLVKIALPDAPGLRSGTFGKARLPGPSRRALTIPLSAIVRRGQVTSVFVVEQNIARVRLIDVRDTEVLAGLVESEIVVASPVGLTDGRRVSTGGL